MEGLNKDNDPSKKFNLELDPKLEYKRQKILELMRNSLDIESCTDMISLWCNEAEQWAEKGLTNRRMVIVNFLKYDFYKAVEDEEGAQECANDAMYMAIQEGYDYIISYIIWYKDKGNL